MIHGEVIGEIWATQKVEGLTGFKMLIVRSPGPHRARSAMADQSGDLVAIDLVGAGVGDRVIVALGHAARIAVRAATDPPIEAAIIGIVDDWHVAGDLGGEVPATAAAAGTPKDAEPRRHVAVEPPAAKPRGRTKRLKKADERPMPPAESVTEIVGRDTGSSKRDATDVADEPDDAEDLTVRYEHEPELPGFGDVDEIWRLSEPDADESDVE